MKPRCCRLVRGKSVPTRQPDGRASTEVARKVTETAMREGSYFVEWKFQRFDGDVFPATVLLTRVEIDGKPELLGTVCDITIQKRAEEERENTTKEIQDLYDNAPADTTRSTPMEFSFASTTPNSPGWDTLARKSSARKGSAT